jgi:hypothetical protein
MRMMKREGSERKLSQRLKKILWHLPSQTEDDYNDRRTPLKF